MYKYLLCWRYLKTRYLAFACIISVTLGVGTLIVVNSVMSGFSTKLRERLHSLLSDVVIEANSIEGFSDPEAKMDLIRNHPYLGSRVEAMSPSMEIFAMLQYRDPMGQMISRPVRLIGVDPTSRAKIGGFHEFLEKGKEKPVPDFELSAKDKSHFEDNEKMLHFFTDKQLRDQQPPLTGDDPPPPEPTPFIPHIPKGAVVGKLIASFRYRDPKEPTKVQEVMTLHPGETITLSTLGGQRMTPVSDRFVVVDYFASEMSEYDNNYIFVPLDYLQHLRTMENRVTTLHIKLKDYEKDSQEVKQALIALLGGDHQVRIETWEDKQGPLLRAIQIEKGILNILLFMIVAVAGFGILAIFSMIVSEKTRDIGILKALGAANSGVMKIFLNYGLLLGCVGVLLGDLLGLGMTYNLNEIETFLASITGEHIFKADVYYFKEIPTNVQLQMIVMVNIGAVLIAVLFSVLPALRAAMLHPVQALRYE